MKLLSTNNTKIQKGEKMGYLTYGLSLAPSRLSGYQTCPMASVGCALACLNTAGMGVFSNVQASRIQKTKWYFEDRTAFLMQLVKDTKAAIVKAKKLDMIPVVRLNLTSDITWEYVPVVVDGIGYPNIFAAFPDVRYYDYTKYQNRDSIPDNYHLTLSRSETNEAACLAHLANGGNVAVVFSGALPDTWHGYPVISGDDDDLRFLDPVGVVVGLKAKGKARKDLSGFVVQS